MDNIVKQKVSTESGTFNALVAQLIDRLYPRRRQNTRRVILKAYFSQSPDRRRRLTLEALGKAEGVEPPVTRERARQVLDQFFSEHLPKEIARLERGQEINDPIMVSNREDLLELRGIISAIVAEIETFDFPIFVDRMQARLKRLDLVDDKIYFPVVIRLAESFSLVMSFDVVDSEGRTLVLSKGERIKSYTSDIITYAGKVATHLGCVCSIDALVNPEWNSKSPESLSKIPKSIRRKFLIDLFETVDGLMLLQDKDYFSFKDRDERVSSILIPIFTVYQSVGKERLFNAVTTGLTHRFMTKTNDHKREYELKVINESQSALDEYCRRTLILDSRPNDERVPGMALRAKLSDYEPGDNYQAQIDMAQAIKQRGGPVSSVEFGKIYRNELKIKDSKKGFFYTYPTLFYKEGEGRKNDFYKTLDGLYEVSVSSDTAPRKTENNKRLENLRQKILQLQEQIHDLEEDKIPSGKIREEQGLLRKYLVETSDGVEMSSGSKSCRCLLCNRYFPAEVLVAAHVKKRSHCSPEEKLDIENIAMLQCGSCDKLFEYGFVYLSDEGEVVANMNAPMTEDILDQLVRLGGNVCEYFNGVEVRKAYVSYHRNQALLRHASS